MHSPGKEARPGYTEGPRHGNTRDPQRPRSRAGSPARLQTRSIWTTHTHTHARARHSHRAPKCLTCRSHTLSKLGVTLGRSPGAQRAPAGPSGPTHSHWRGLSLHKASEGPGAAGSWRLAQNRGHQPGEPGEAETTGRARRGARTTRRCSKRRRPAAGPTEKGSRSSSSDSAAVTDWSRRHWWGPHTRALEPPLVPRRGPHMGSEQRPRLGGGRSSGPLWRRLGRGVAKGAAVLGRQGSGVGGPPAPRGSEGIRGGRGGPGGEAAVCLECAALGAPTVPAGAPLA